ncbi:TraR/DksA C4-type zinc finger protein [Photobacterium sp. TY1-4]|uniref:TraR/DksA C4-type zinc finger protein n=1 Tax=Photobacterium sp. TY1-4 TaxID=2899122 RepID=UPI0021BFDAE4|nr:TraR/DksA C4-type zinc finger protein [Photobacterium sp. TY1-4]UXI00433.1 TraR/DksA C4-type zinc finger protein [Photobacterium sp. TY1-4]
MSDVIDQGCRIEAQFRKVALANQLAASAAAKANGAYSETDCAECGDEIPQKRREQVPGCRYCTPCQQLAEKGKL